MVRPTPLETLRVPIRIYVFEYALRSSKSVDHVVLLSFGGESNPQKEATPYWTSAFLTIRIQNVDIMKLLTRY